MKTSFVSTLALLFFVIGTSFSAAIAQNEFSEVKLPLFKNPEDVPANFRRENLVAWCIVPFDVKKRSPEDRTAMLGRMGIKRCAYDWRQEHVPTFEREIEAYKKNGVEFTAFWSQHDKAFELFKKHAIKPQVWFMMKQPKAKTQEEKVAEAVKTMTPLAERCKQMNCKLGLYNHGGWAGEPENLVAVCNGLRAKGFADVGIVYNFHHAHDRITDAQQFTKSLELMKPLLLCLNLNGMVDHSGLNTKQKREQKIRAIGTGDYEAAMIDAVVKSKYAGPIGVLGHVATRDVEEVLQKNVEGLEYVLGSRVKPDWLAKADEAKYMEKWTPKARANSKFPYESKKDPDWVDDRASKMDTGLTFNHSIIVPFKKKKTGKLTKHKFVKAIAVKASAANDGSVECFDVSDEVDEKEQTPAHLLFDSQQLNVTACWTGDFIEIPPARFGILKMPTVKGDVQWATTDDMRWQVADKGGKFSSVDKSQSRFMGHFHPIISPAGFEYRIHGTSIKDTVFAFNNQHGTSIVRLIHRKPSDDNLRLPIRKISELVRSRRGKTDPFSSLLVKDSNEKLLLAMSGFELEVENNVLYANLPATQTEKFDFIALQPCDEESFGALEKMGIEIREAIPKLKTELNSYPKQRWGNAIKASAEETKTQTEAGSTEQVAINPKISKSAFIVDTIPVPLANKHKALMFTSGLDFIDARRAFICTVHGDVWLVDGLDGDLKKVTWKRYATGLYQPLGLRVVDGKPIVMCRDRLTRLHDQNGDDEADYYENFNDGLELTGQPHAYAMNLETDPDGNFYFIKSGGSAPHGGTMLRLSADGKSLSVHATGYRHANGLGVSPKGVVTSADNEGNWIPATRIDMVQPGGFYGHMPTHRRETKPEIYDDPLLWMPRSIDNSAGGQTWVPENNAAWKPLAGKMIHFSFGRCTANVVLPQKVDGKNQAAIYRLDTSRFLSGSMRGRFNPFDGNLYVCGLDGWQTAAVQDGHFQRVRATGRPFYQPTDFAVYKDRIEIAFDVALKQKEVASLNNWLVQQWNYRWSKDYGSDHFSLKDPNKVGHDDVPVDKVEVSDDGKVVRLFIKDLKPVMQMSIRAKLVADDGHPIELEVFNTIHSLPK